MSENTTEFIRIPDEQVKQAKAGVDLRKLAATYTTLKPKGSQRAKEWEGPCPVCGGTDRFYVQAAWFGCRGCDINGDAIDFIKWVENKTFLEAYTMLTGEDVTKRAPRDPGDEGGDTQPFLEAPGAEWQKRARDFVAASQAALWSDAGAGALKWLRGRGLEDGTIVAACLGYNPTKTREPLEAWGLPGEDGKTIWLPRAIVIPWLIGGDIWRVRFRLPVKPSDEMPKYINVKGGRNALYLADTLNTRRPAILIEGEIDALTISQVAGDLVTPVATGGTNNARQARWIARLALTPGVLLGFDNDGEEKGEKAAKYWLGALSNARRWRPFWGDANQMSQDGADVRAWIEAAFLDSQDEPGDPQDVPEGPQGTPPGATTHQDGPGATETAGNELQDVTSQQPPRAAQTTPTAGALESSSGLEPVEIKLEDLDDYCRREGLTNARVLVTDEGLELVA